MDSLIEHAKRELELAGFCYPDADATDIKIAESIIALLEVFEKQNHTTYSAQRTMELLSTLAVYEPLTPLTGEDSEWSPIEGTYCRNIRCPRVYKKVEGDTVGYIDTKAKVFVEENGDRFTNYNSREEITFPYTPQTRIVNVLYKPIKVKAEA